jgi:hypothetical protein
MRLGAGHKLSKKLEERTISKAMDLPRQMAEAGFGNTFHLGAPISGARPLIAGAKSAKSGIVWNLLASFCPRAILVVARGFCLSGGVDYGFGLGALVVFDH